MKKFFKSKGFLVTVLSVSCIAILAACWLVGRDTKTDFLPDEQHPESEQCRGQAGRLPKGGRGIGAGSCS